MRRILFIAIAAALVCCQSAVACGDKFLVIGRGASYRNRYVAIHPATILLYGQRAATDGNTDVKRILQRAGHRVTFAPDEAHLLADLQSTSYDFVLTPLDDVEKTENRVRSVAPNTLVLPVFYASNDEEVRRAETQYQCIARSDEKTKQRSFLAVLDDAMAMRLKGQTTRCRWTQ